MACSSNLSERPASPPPDRPGGASRDAAAPATVPRPVAEGRPTSPERDAGRPARPFVPQRLPDGYLHYTDACLPGTQVTIAAVGDLLVHHELQRQALKAKNGFVAIWEPVVDLLAKAELTYANLEGPTARGLDRQGNKTPDPGKRFDDKVYTGYPRFNYHPSIARDLVTSGVDIVSMANNHALDRAALGLDRTLDVLDSAGLNHFGARRQGTDAPWYVVTEINGVALAWVGCTLYTNQPDKHGQVMHCFKKPDRVTPLVRKLAQTPTIDAVIVTPHMGKEYVPNPGKKEQKLVRKLLDAGALAVIGSHPHVLQPWEKHVTPDGRETFTLFSLGNFCSHQRPLPRRSSMILFLGLTKGHDGVTRVNGARYVPLHVRMEGDMERFFVEAIDRAGGPQDSRALTTAMFGELNIIAPEDPIVTNPHCDPTWPHHVK
ncbi:MAG: CapA family protein [Proteobacteria bacterium]|nr:CapA family protein [Pseudomonadota bacterium]